MATTFSYTGGGEFILSGTADVAKIKAYVGSGEIKFTGNAICRIVKQYPVGVFTTGNRIRTRPFGAVRP